MKNTKIVLTGGPCGGKTSSVRVFAERLSKQYDVLIIEETAASLLKLGYLDEYSITTLDFQDLLFKIQFINEYYGELNSNLLLCDRGLFDALAYIDKFEFDEIITRNKLNKHLIKSTYDKALYFRTIAYEYPESFILERMYETPDIAIARDIKSLQAWKDKLLNFKANNTIGFQNKQNMIFDELIKYLNSISNNNETYKLSDYYSEKTIENMKDGIYKIYENNKIPKHVRKKTMELIK